MIMYWNKGTKCIKCRKKHIEASVKHIHKYAPLVYLLKNLIFLFFPFVAIIGNRYVCILQAHNGNSSRKTLPI